MKKLLSLIMALCLICSVTSFTAFAAEATTTRVESSQNTESTPVEATENPVSTRKTTYNQVWIDAGKFDTGSFKVKNPHTFIGTTTYGTLKIESNNPSAMVEIIVHDGMQNIYSNIIGPRNGEINFSTSNNSNYYIVEYFVSNTNRTDGIRINCWLY